MAEAFRGRGKSRKQVALLSMWIELSVDIYWQFQETPIFFFKFCDGEFQERLRNREISYFGLVWILLGLFVSSKEASSI